MWSSSAVMIWIMTRPITQQSLLFVCGSKWQTLLINYIRASCTVVSSSLLRLLIMAGWSMDMRRILMNECWSRSDDYSASLVYVLHLWTRCAGRWLLLFIISRQAANDDLISSIIAAGPECVSYAQFTPPTRRDGLVASAPWRTRWLQSWPCSQYSWFQWQRNCDPGHDQRWGTWYLYLCLGAMHLFPMCFTTIRDLVWTLYLAIGLAETNNNVKASAIVTSASTYILSSFTILTKMILCKWYLSQKSRDTI